MPQNPRCLVSGLEFSISEFEAEYCRANNIPLPRQSPTERLRALRESGVITRFRADVDPAALGLPLQAVIRVRLGSHNRDQVQSFHAILREVPGALAIFHVGGEDDYLIHVAVESAAALRDLVLEHVTVHPAVRHTETQLVFEVIRGAGVLSRANPRGRAPSTPHAAG